MERWPFMVVNFVGTITTTAATYDWQTNCQDLINLLVIDPNNNALPLHYIPYEVFDRRYPDPAQLTKAPPTVWTKVGNTFTVGPALPNATYTLQQRYLKEPTTLTSDANLVDIPDAFSEIITLGVLARAQEVNDDYDLAQITWGKRNSYVKRMKKRLLLPPSGEAVSNDQGRRRDLWNDNDYPWLD